MISKEELQDISRWLSDDNIYYLLNKDVPNGKVTAIYMPMSHHGGRKCLVAILKPYELPNFIQAFMDDPDYKSPNFVDASALVGR